MRQYNKVVLLLFGSLSLSFFSKANQVLLLKQAMYQGNYNTNTNVSANMQSLAKEISLKTYKDVIEGFDDYIKTTPIKGFKWFQLYPFTQFVNDLKIRFPNQKNQIDTLANKYFYKPMLQILMYQGNYNTTQGGMKLLAQVISLKTYKDVIEGFDDYIKTTPVKGFKWFQVYPFTQFVNDLQTRFAHQKSQIDTLANKYFIIPAFDHFKKIGDYQSILTLMNNSTWGKNNINFEKHAFNISGGFWWKNYLGVNKNTNCLDYCQSIPPCTTDGRNCDYEFIRSYRDDKGYHCNCGWQTRRAGGAY